MAVQAGDKTNKSRVDQLPVSVVIPCRAEYIGLCRLLAGVVASRNCMQPEEIADMKLVVTEACTCFFWGTDEEPEHEAGSVSPPKALRVEFEVTPEEWQVTVFDPEHAHRIPEETEGDPSGTDRLGLTIMRALVDELDLSYSEAEGSVIKVKRRIDARSDD